MNTLATFIQVNQMDNQLALEEFQIKCFKFYFKGKITRIINSNQANIEFDNGFKQNNVPLSDIMKIFDVTSYFLVREYFLCFKKINQLKVYSLKRLEIMCWPAL